MPRIPYRSINFRPASLQIIAHANAIARDYASQGLSLTLRQLYYRFVAADLIPNRQTEYKRLGSIINDARYAGLFDWGLITDRTRNVQGGDSGYTPGHPEEVIDPDYYHVTQWEGQKHRIEVWVEKDALIDVLFNATATYRVPRFSCRGYTSSSEIWGAARRIEGYLSEPDVEKVTILHLGDHDPSGIDMTRDIAARTVEFIEYDLPGIQGAISAPGYDASTTYDPDDADVVIKRIALNMDQIRQYSPPPNPAKETDSRFAGYLRVHGDESWELDALEPRTLIDLIQGEIRPLIDADKWAERSRITAEGRATLKAVRDNYPTIIDDLKRRGLISEYEGGTA